MPLATRETPFLLRALRLLRTSGTREFLRVARAHFLFRWARAARVSRFWLLKLQAKDRFQIYEIQGSKMALDLEDLGLSLDLVLDGVREPLSTRALPSFLRKGDVALDIGSNIGYYLLQESRLVGAEGRVYGLEPEEENFRLLQRNIALNRYDNVEVFQLAAGAENMEASMYLSRHSNLHSLVTPTESSQATQPTTVVTVDQFLADKPRPSFIRMDVEGYEYEVLLGMEKILERPDPLVLFIEVHPHFLGARKTGLLLNILDQARFETVQIAKSWLKEQEMARGGPPDFSFHHLSDLLANSSFVSGELGAFEIFFKRE